MRTKLPSYIETVKEAKKFLEELYNNGENYHPEDDAHQVLWAGSNIEVSGRDCDRLNRLMQDIYDLDDIETRKNPLGFCPCEYLLNLDPEYKRTSDLEAFTMAVDLGEFEQETLKRIAKRKVVNYKGYTPALKTLDKYGLITIIKKNTISITKWGLQVAELMN